MSLQDLVDKETYKSYLHRLDVRALLEYYGAEHMTEQANRDGTIEIVHSCLLDRVMPHHSNGDQNPSASCNLESRKYVCYSLNYGCDLFHLVKKLEGKESFMDSMGVIGQFLAGSTLSTEDFKAELEKLFTKENVHVLDLPSYDRSVLLGFNHPHPYWETRGITGDAQRTLSLGYDPTAHRIVFPHFVDGNLVGWQKRVTPETIPDFPKYKNSPGFPKSETLYNWDRAKHCSSVVVVESPMSVAKATSLGVQNVVATFGAKINQCQVDLLSTFDRVFVWFDRDGAGISGETKLLEGLHQQVPTYAVTPDWGKDMGDCTTQDEIVQKLYEATPAITRLGERDFYRRMHKC